MADTQREVLTVLLRTLLDREMVAKSAYEKALNLVHSTMDFPGFFEYCVLQKERETNGCTENQK